MAWEKKKEEKGFDFGIGWRCGGVKTISIEVLP